MKQAEKIDKMFYAVFGYNGDNNGLVKKQDKLAEKIDALFRRWDDFILKREETCPLKSKSNTQVDKRMKYLGFVLQAAGWATLLSKIMGWW